MIVHPHFQNLTAEEATDVQVCCLIKLNLASVNRTFFHDCGSKFHRYLSFATELLPPIVTCIQVINFGRVKSSDV
jgi:hypothetical protein